MIAKVEKANETRYSKLYKNLEKGPVLEKDGIVVLKYRNCGGVPAQRQKVPQKRPPCLHQSYFEVETFNY